MRVAYTRPPYCAACFQHPEEDCIDFEAAYDGPVIPGSPTMTVDDLIICKSCLTAAATMLELTGMGEAEREEYRKTMVALRLENRNQRELIAESARIQQRYSDATGVPKVGDGRRIPGKSKKSGIDVNLEKRIAAKARRDKEKVATGGATSVAKSES